MIIALQTLVFFRESLLSVVNRFLSPYYKRLTFNQYSREDEEESEEEVFADFDDDKGVVFFPPVYAQRYAAVSDCLIDERWRGKLEKVVDIGYHDMSFIKYLKEVPGVSYILGVDIESLPLRCASDLFVSEEYAPKRESPLTITLFQGNAADPDYRLIGCDAVVAIEMIEHMLPHDLDRLVHTVFGFIKPWVAVFTTPNADFNVLFHNLEKNGLRRLDHFFEWSREQFHDWCSNIVTRYPNYTVTCQGVGPGPPGTRHHGCCSQLALFVSKHYVKQQDLDLDSLALVSKVPSPNHVADLMAGCISPEPVDTETIINRQEHVESLSSILYSGEDSCVTIVIASPSTVSLPALAYSDKTSQCNLDTETGKSFLMFNYEDMCFTVLMPRRRNDYRVYDIEDVSSRLNCSTFQVKKFSKTTQGLLAKNKMDALVHHREVIDEIKHLTKMLNFNKSAVTDADSDCHHWRNYNWGDNAPYWNQYYKIIKEYNYPFETKSDESRILDLISEEINTFVDSQSENLHTERNRIEIPMEKLMKVVQHITTDVDKVKDLLEWNGYEIVSNMVIHSRLAVDDPSVMSCDDDWGEHDTSTYISDFDTTDVLSTTTDGSALMPDYHDRVIRRALDSKMHALRDMLSADEDITSELDRVVCRLTSLALRTSKRKQTPPPTRWMQCKLLDLLTLTEKAISRRKKHLFQTPPISSIGYSHEEIKEFIEGHKGDDTARCLVKKYSHLINAVENRENYDPFDFRFEDEIGDQDKYSDIMRGFETNEKRWHLLDGKGEEADIKDRAPDWLIEGDIESVSYPDHSENIEKILKSSPGTSNYGRYRYVKGLGFGTKFEGKSNMLKRSYNRINDDKHKRDDRHKSKRSRTSILKKLYLSKNPSFSIGRKGFEHGGGPLKPKRIKPVATKPIPDSVAEVFQQDLYIETKKEETDIDKNCVLNEIPVSDISATEQLGLVDILSQDKEETVFLLRSIATETFTNSIETELSVTGTSENLTYTVKEDAQNECYSNVSETEQHGHFDIISEGNTETLHFWRSIGIDPIMDTSDFMPNANETMNSVTENAKADVQNLPQDVQSQTIFLYDINEPSTSKGLRHVSMDVQCGTDPMTPPSYGSLAPPSSPNKLPNFFTNGIKISDSLSNMASQISEICTTQDFEPSTNEDERNCSPLCSNLKSSHNNCNVMQLEDSLDHSVATKMSSDLGTFTDTVHTDFVKPTRTTKIRIKDSLTELRGRSYSDFATSTPNADGCADESKRERKCERFRAWSPVRRNVGIRIKDSTPDVTSKNEYNLDTHSDDNIECVNNIRSQSAKDRDSLSNLFVDFDESPAYRSRSPDRIKRPYADNLLDIKYGVGLGNSTANIANGSDVVSLIEEQHDNVNGSSSNDVYTNEKYFADHPLSIDNAILRHDSRSTRKQGTKVVTMHNCILESQNDTDAVTNAAEITPEDNNQKYAETDVLKKVNFVMIPTEFLPNSKRQAKNNDLGSINKKEAVKTVSSRTKIHEPSLEVLSDNDDKLIKSENQCMLRTPYSQTVVDKITTLTISKQQKLSRGGVHIHSFKEKQVTEDVVYLGGWQRQNQNAKVQRKRSKHYFKPQKKWVEGNHVFSKKFPEVKKTLSREKVQVKRIEKKRETNNNNWRKPSYVQSMKSNKIELTRKPIVNSIKTLRVKSKSLTKITASLGMSSITAESVIKSSKRNMKTQSAKIASSINKDHDDKIQPMVISHILKKNYLPAYLRKNKLPYQNINKQITDENNLDAKKLNTDLLKFQNNVHVNYVVFRNELENSDLSSNHGQSAGNTNRSENPTKKSSAKRFSSPVSQTSSTCSSPGSTETVRAMSTWSKNAAKKVLNITHKNSPGSVENESNIPTRNKKFTKRCKTKSVKTSKDENKENVPESSKKCISEKDCLQNVKNSILRRNKKVIMAQYAATESGLALDNMHSSSRKSNIKIPADETKKPKSACILNKKSLQLHDSSCNEDGYSENSSSTEDAKTICIVMPQSNAGNPIQSNVQKAQSSKENEKPAKSVDNKLIEWFDRNNATVNQASTESTILAAMRQIIEERLDFIGSSCEDCQDLDDTASMKSNKTVVPKDLDSELDRAFQSEFETSSFDAIGPDELSVSAESKHGTNDLELLSAKSIAASSKYSEYFLADSEYHSADASSVVFTDDSVREIFERKEPTPTPNTIGPLLSQDFSGFSMDTDLIVGDQADLVNLVDSEVDSLALELEARQDNEPGSIAEQPLSDFPLNVEHIARDQPDYVNVVDSETGSVALEFVRPITSEDLYISGRSSESYESCSLDEDVIIPNWLFNIINHQPSGNNDDEHHQELVPLPLPLVEPTFDMNGNVMEPNVSLGAGAGDGRGMHSDHSQDSSGRGSSLSSTESSSGQQSEASSSQAILIDPSAFTAQYELLHEPVSSSMAVTTLVVPIDSPEAAANRQGVGATDTVHTRSGNPLRLNIQTLALSDGEADVSSTDTEVHDSSDN